MHQLGLPAERRGANNARTCHGGFFPPAIAPPRQALPPDLHEDAAVDATLPVPTLDGPCLPHAAPHDASPEWGMEAPVRGRGLNARALARAMDYIDRHIGDNLSLSDIAASACISRFHFARLFRVSTGRSPMEYVLARRIALAKAQLARGPQKISATAASLGFFDQSHFTRTFRRMTGYSPREFRLMHAPVTEVR